MGYTKAIWENDGSPPTEDLDWHQLSQAEQEAAHTLGYNQQKWDGEEGDMDTASYATPIASDAIPTPAEADLNDRANSVVSESGGNETSSEDVPTSTSMLDQIIASCSFDSNNDSTEHSNSPSVTDSLSYKISSLLGMSSSEDASKHSQDTSKQSF